MKPSTVLSQRSPRRHRARSVLIAALAASLSALFIGCASLPPSDLDLRQAEIVTDTAPPVLSTDGHSGKLGAAGSGAAKGGGTGALVGSLACLGTGFLFPLCVGAVVPTTAAIGAVTWGTASAVTSDSAEAVDAKKELLKVTFEALSAPALLTQHLQTAARERNGIDLSAASESHGGQDVPSGAPPALWQIELAFTGAACEDTRPSQPFALRVEGRTRLRRSGQPEVIYERSLARKSDLALTTDQWRADDAAAAKTGIDQAVRQLAEALLIDLSQRPRAASR